MNQSKLGAYEKHSNCFFAPHKIYEDEKLRELSHAERDFLIALCHLRNRCGDKNGWFWHVDRSFNDKYGRKMGFETLGFGSSTCKRVRKKLVELGLIETKPHTVKGGAWPATMYRINPKLFHNTVDHSGLRLKTMMDSGPGPP
ncbi:MAG: hypothetical protein A2528_02845 [Candidatus Staskawiczbacteria bacterium RIFOXYD2_FULL_37_9]|uniref:Bacteriophage lambda Replication protein O N-terminal domain-containing protein n=1 Tax=Candidatus Staskawiczbacteria bacterium RIFOXYB1_FULL_37_44 TaxID=1802223 RepID=A0A1G2IXY4_9BACT|nr:MAG: hypothetical protein A2358_00735 [Candidatus Staskawiczbacteria bacterium RIFOXYB1_FULL_37_44]OGZ84479.1 MAG: hypothetical protein A2416_03010 [Candidatus Staskawiczbacteria bacterium RIFOXYC1_FULL_37_52]OGZ89221.1 MAG: hypothetical protein A2444_01805 [Candidatus Staskawiczbacteria bacterium RIFOXYC2_FULL_37_19]OGZ89937.1 MAG: hypothetical protein A2581_04050 [Candidatus Staskawiczbacteria bacterium RIFOXYD1_FULL_37_110]OGZ93507.1 MAG: hypothetical protein A2528_02845 [Candidatus Stask